MSILTAAMAHALANGSPRGLFVAIEHPDGTGYFCTGIGSRSWDGRTWNGTGTLGSITPVKASSEIAIEDITFRLSGVSADVIADLDDNVRNLSGVVWLACFDDYDQVIADPYKLVDAELDYQSFNVDEDGTATVEITAHAGFYTLARAVEEAWTPENQKLRYPTDTGMDMIPSLQKQDLQWKPVE